MKRSGLYSITSLILFTVSLLASPARAETAGHIKLEMAVQKEITVTEKDGTQKVQLVEPKIAVPGDEMIYTITYTNVSIEPTTAVVVTDRIPEQMTYVQNTAKGERTGVLFSIDGVEFAAQEQLKVRAADGGWRPATERDLTYVRWVVNATVPPGESGSVSYRARLQ